MLKKLHIGSACFLVNVKFVFQLEICDLVLQITVTVALLSTFIYCGNARQEV